MTLISKVFSSIRIRGPHEALSIINPSGVKIFCVNTTPPNITSYAPFVVDGTVAFNDSILGVVLQSIPVAAATTLTASQSGTLITISQSSSYEISLPLPTGGLNYKFLLTGPGAFAVTIASTLFSLTGTIVDGAPSASSFTGLKTMTFESTAALGDNIDFYATDGTWFVRAFSSVGGGITTS